MRLGLRIDVDTLRGTIKGVSSLCKVLADSSIRATFFFSVGPDNMGRHLWRLLRPAFLRKMLRTRATSLYGWDILLRGAFWPGPVIGKRASEVIRAASEAGHEIGLHAWDHHRWQSRIDRMSRADIQAELERGVEMLGNIIRRTPTCSAAPAWKCNDLVLGAKTRFPFRYNSDCRGHSIFLPVVGNVPLAQPQVPVTLPTYDETIDVDGITAENHNEHLLSLLAPEKLNVLTIHAEVEGIACADMFRRFVQAAVARGITIIPLGELLPEPAHTDQSRIVPGNLPGREGWVALQS